MHPTQCEIITLELYKEFGFTHLGYHLICFYVILDSFQGSIDKTDRCSFFLRFGDDPSLQGALIR